MVRSMVALVSVLGMAAAAWADCTCAKIALTGGWCEGCKMGHMQGLTIKSQKLYAALAGKEITAEAAKEMKCPGCKKALAENGACGHCQVTFVNQHMFRSPFAATLAAGKPLTECLEQCCKACQAQVAKKGMEKACQGSGWCDECKSGCVWGRVYSGKEAYDAAQKAYAVLAKAVKASSSCEECAIAMVTNGECTACKVKFDGGELVKNP